SPARHRPGARSARRQRWPARCIADRFPNGGLNDVVQLVASRAIGFPVYPPRSAAPPAAGTGVSSFETGFNNSGTVEVQAGTLRRAGGSASTGRFTVQAGTTLEFEGGTHLLAAASAVDGAGQVAFSAVRGNSSISIVQGGYTVTGSTRVVTA